MGLQLNIPERELISGADHQVSNVTLRSFSLVFLSQTLHCSAPRSFLVWPLTIEAWATRCSELSRADGTLKCLGSQDALILLRSSFSAPRVHHLLHCCPSIGHPALLTFDEHLRSAVSLISNYVLSDDQWLQASVPIKDCGLGNRRVSSYATPAFLASAASILSSSVQNLSFLYLHIRFCSSSLPNFLSVPIFLPPPDSLPSKQSFYNRPGISSVHMEIESSLVTNRQRASFLAAAAPHSSD